MEISSLSKYFQELQKLQSLEATKEESSQSSKKEEVQKSVTDQMDTYIPSNVTGNEILCSDNYNELFGQQRQQSQSSVLSQISGTSDTTSTTSSSATDSTSATADSVGSLMGEISSTMRVNPDAIEQTMSELGLSTSDLYDSDNMSKLVAALNSKASEMGLQTVDDTSSAASSLSSYASESASSVQSSYSLTDEQWEALLEEFSSIANATSTASTTSTGSQTSTTSGVSSTSATSSTSSTSSLSDTSQATSATSATASSLDDLLDKISETMKVNKESILETMDELGLSASDLYDSDSMSKLVDALNSKASELGLSTVDDTTSTAASLSSYASDSASSVQSSHSITETEWEELLTKISSLISGSSDSTDSV